MESFSDHDLLLNIDTCTQQEHLNNKNGRIDFLSPTDLDFHDCHLELGGNSHYIMYCMKMIVDSIN